MEFPGCQGKHLSVKIENRILEGRVDCGFLRLPAHPDLETCFWTQDKPLVVLPVNHDLADCGRFPAGALADHPFMLLESSKKNCSLAVRRFIEYIKYRWPKRPVFIFSHQKT